MRNLLLAATALTVVSAPAFAADLPARTAPAAPVVYAPAFTWTGFYVGLNAGYGWADGTDVFVTRPTGVVDSFTGGSNGGFTGGGQLGYNWQSGAFVFGLEADIQYADFGSALTYGVYPLSGSEGNYWGSVRGRLGYAIDRTLLYVTGGLAYGDVGTQLNSFSSGDTQAGWVLGAGVEYAFTNNWTGRIEGLWLNIDRSNAGGTITIPAGAAVPAGVYGVGARASNEFGVVRAAINYKF
jgi:outer membrane immunogenic protein